MKVRDVLRELHRLGLGDLSIEIADDTGDRYSHEEWVKELPVVRIVIVPDPYSQTVPLFEPGGESWRSPATDR